MTWELRPLPAMLVLGVLILTDGSSMVPDAVADGFTFTAAVAQVKDGDTIVVFRNKNRIVVNLPSVDAPELDQPFGLEAKRFTAKLVKGKVVILKTYEAGNPLYAEVWFDKNRNLGRELIRAGLAWPKIQDQFSEMGQMQSMAKAAKVGLWEDEDPIAPWEWRNGKRPKP